MLITILYIKHIQYQYIIPSSSSIHIHHLLINTGSELGKTISIPIMKNMGIHPVRSSMTAYVRTLMMMIMMMMMMKMMMIMMMVIAYVRILMIMMMMMMIVMLKLMMISL